MSKDFLERWINREEQAQVALVSAPMTFPPVPAVALSIFQSALDAAGITSRVVYCAFPMAYLMGMDMIYRFSDAMDFLKNAEYLCAHLTDVSAAVSPRTFVDTFCTWMPEKDRDSMAEEIDRARKMAEVLVDAAARRIIHMGARVAAASSTFAQQSASLAILKRVKELDPSVKTILGGYNTSGEMGLNVLRHFPSVDYVSFGEGDETFAQVCAALLAGSEGPMPYGTLKHGDPLPETAPYRMTRDMNTVAVPDYRDYFEDVRLEEDGFFGGKLNYDTHTYDRSIFLEGSRGCWWGAKHPCSFCGLNGLTNVYREKTPAKLYAEIREMTARHPGTGIQLTDNVLSANMIRELLPMLAADGEKYEIMAEIKTNLTPDEVKALGDAGVTVTQPGIESLNDHLLKLMGKGSSAAQNLALMKYCTTFGVFPIWNMMTHVPGEEREDYEQMLELIPLIKHLPPPTRTNSIGFMRFSRYAADPEKYGLVLAADSLYRCCFSGHPEISDNFGVYYELAGGSFQDTIRQNRDLYRQLSSAVVEWRNEYYSDKRAALTVTENFFGLMILDTRPCAPVNSRMLMGLSAAVYRLAWRPVSMKTLAKKLPGYPEEKIQQTLDSLTADKLMVCVSDRYLALASVNVRRTA